MARKQPIPFITAWRGAREKEAEKDIRPTSEARGLSPMPFPPTARSSKSALSVRIPTVRAGDAHRMPIGEGALSTEMQYPRSAVTQGPSSIELQSPLSPTSPALTQMAENMHRLTMSVQRLESGMSVRHLSEAEDGGPVLQRPPAYGDRRA
jgi:hypothetical protein